jgi:hypothetical protein
VRDTVVYSSGIATVTLTGSAAFSNTNYVCTVVDMSNPANPNAFQVTRSTGSSFTINTKGAVNGMAAYI